MRINKTVIGFVLLLSLGLGSFIKHPSSENQPVSSLPAHAVLEWNKIAYDAFGGTKYLHSPMASRINAMVHLAIHDALNGIEEKYERYAFKGKDSKADPLIAVASAAYEILLNEIPEKKGFLDSTFARALLQIKNGDAKKRGIALGKLAAQAIINLRKNDGGNGDIIGKIHVSKLAGVYQAVPPFDFSFAPYWKDVKPFSIKSNSQFRCSPYPGLNTQQYATGFNEVKETGSLKSTSRSTDQSHLAKFWYEFSEAGWNRVARTVVNSKKLNLLDAARLFALVDMAMADAYIAGWDSKLHFNFWRPYTAIRKADQDDNKFTLSDANWEPFMPTPPVPDYPSTHSALGNAAASVIAALIGDQTPFSMKSPTADPDNTVRSFKSLSQAANENADSRVRAGIHFRFSCDAGQQLGNRIGQWTVENNLKKLK